MKEDSNNKKIVLFCAPTLSKFKEVSICEGVRSCIDDKTQILVALPFGISPTNTHYHYYINKLGVDIALLTGGALSTQENINHFNNLVNHYGPEKSVIIGPPLDGYRTISIDNKQGIEELVLHLVQQCNCKTFATVRGPLGSPEAEERLHHLQQALKKHNLFLDKSHIIQGSFFATQSLGAIKEYVTSHSTLPDVFICANDLSAKDTIQALTDQGFQVPNDTLVTGFDDFDYARPLQVPLTTIKQPTELLGERALNAAMDLTNVSEPLVEILPTKLICRDSTKSFNWVKRKFHLKTDRSIVWSTLKYRELSEFRLYISRAFTHYDSTLDALESVSEYFPVIDLNAFFLFYIHKSQSHSEKVTLENSIINGSYVKYSSRIGIDNFFSNSLFKQTDATTHGTWIIAPVTVRDDYLGFILCKIEFETADYIEILAVQIADSFDAERIKLAEEKLNIQLIQNEKMAALGGLVSGVAHEVNTPLGVSKLATSNLSSEVKTILELYRNGTLKKTELELFLEVCSNSSRIIETNIDRASQLIRSFKKVAVDQDTEEQRQIDISSYFEEILESLMLKIKNTKVTVKTELEHNIQFTTYPGVWAQILNNIMLNAVVHGFDEGREVGKIHIKTMIIKDYCVVMISDDGRGISLKVINHIFEPFVTTKRGQGGTGLGLHIVYNLVTQKLKGELEVVSEQNKGSTFIIRVPMLTA